MKRWTVYCHQHIESGRRYIGLTVHTMMHRWNQHCAQAKNLKNEQRSHFAAAIRKYGKDAFSHEILAQSSSLGDANATEEALIEQWNTRDPDVGFNLVKGGLHVPHSIRKNPWDRPEYREKQLSRTSPFNTRQARDNNKAALNTSESRIKRTAASKAIWDRPGMRECASRVHTGRKHRPETLAKMSIAASGKTASTETREKLRKLSLGRKHTDETKVKIGKVASRTNLLRNPAIMERLFQGNRKFVSVEGRITHKVCSTHGTIEISKCYVSKTKAGKPRVMCRECELENLRRRRTAQ